MPARWVCASLHGELSGRPANWQDGSCRGSSAASHAPLSGRAYCSPRLQQYLLILWGSIGCRTINRPHAAWHLCRACLKRALCRASSRTVKLNANADAETTQEQARTPLLPLRWSTASSMLYKHCMFFTASIRLQIRERRLMSGSHTSDSHPRPGRYEIAAYVDHGFYAHLTSGCAARMIACVA